MASADDNYVCHLDARSAEKAKKELTEDPKDRLNAVAALRTWIQQQPHITFSTGRSKVIISSLCRLMQLNYVRCRLCQTVA